MTWLKIVADGLTGLRLVLAVVLALLGPLGGVQRLNAAAVLVLVAWTTDLFDGPLARRSGMVGQSWLGRNDLTIDIVLGMALLLYMAVIDMVPLCLALGHVALWGIVLWRYGRITKPLGAAFQGPIYLWLGLSLLVRRMLLGRVMLLWLLGNVAATWDRLTRRDIPQFFQGLCDLFRGRADMSPESERR